MVSKPRSGAPTTSDTTFVHALVGADEDATARAPGPVSRRAGAVADRVDGWSLPGQQVRSPAPRSPGHPSRGPPPEERSPPVAPRHVADAADPERPLVSV